MSIYTKDEIDERVEKLLKKYDMRDIPIDPIKLADLMGIAVKEGDFLEDGISGVLTKREGIPTIIVNREHSYTRKRFTIAHEIAHFALGHRDMNGDFADIYRDGQSNKEEQQANQFAAALLVNKADLKEKYKFINKLGISRSKSISILSDIYNVSEQTLKYRLDNVGI